MSIDNSRIVDTIVDTDYHPIDASNQMTDLDIICNRCTVFDSRGKIVLKSLMKYDARNERFICEKCRRVVGEKQVRTALHLNQEEYIHYEPMTPVKQTIQRRLDKENYIIKPNNPVPLNDPSRTPRAVVINNRREKRDPLNNDINEEFK